MYYFDKDACACFFDEDKFSLSLESGTFIPRNYFFPGSEQSPLSPFEAFLTCQIEEIYNHNLDSNCEANVTELDYDYRTTLTRHFGFNHEHGPPN